MRTWLGSTWRERITRGERVIWTLGGLVVIVGALHDYLGFP